MGTEAPKGVLHTTEGSLESALATFKRANAPTFLLGRDRNLVTQVLQLRPLGACAASLEHPAGTPETNRAVLAQVEIAGYSQRIPWLPLPDVVDALAHLMLALRDTQGIPLRHLAAQRDEKVFARGAGWLGHADVPNNTHWDPGALRWQAMFDACARLDTAEPIDPAPSPRRLDVLRDGRSWLVGQKATNAGLWSRVRAAASAGRTILIQETPEGA